MQEKTNRKFWQAPWGYSESFAIVIGLIIIGLALQIAVHSFDFYLLARPVNFVVCAFVVVSSVVLGIFIGKSSLSKFFTSVPLSVALICALGVLSIIMGVMPQSTHSHTLLGFDAMTSNWAFVLVYFFTLLSLGAITFKRLKRFRFKDLFFTLNHLGLYILLLSSALGAADMQRYIMYVSEGETQWRVYDGEKNVKELPIAIYLEDFKVDFYPSKAIYFDAQTGEIQKGNPKKYENNERYKKVMTEPEPKRFASDIEVFTESGTQIKTTLEVNKPLKIGSWTIYQYGYDNRAGNLSEYSSFELVYDSWLEAVYLGIILMMLGSASMIFTRKKTKEL
ncbi:MAG: cytochrome c biogenesis protein ResB [Rikenellaceae bacterium]